MLITEHVCLCVSTFSLSLQLRKKLSDLQQLHEEKKKKEENMKKLKEQLENKKTEVHLFICIWIY